MTPTPLVDELLELYRASASLLAADVATAELAAERGAGYYRRLCGREVAMAAASLSLRAEDWLYSSSPAPDARGLDLRCGRDLRVVWGSQPSGARAAQAMGTAWAARLRREPKVVLTFMGEALLGGPDLHVALNFAGVYKAPLMVVALRPTPAWGPPAEERALAWGIRGLTAQASQPVECWATMRQAASHARDTGPALVDVLLDHPAPTASLRAALVDLGVHAETLDAVDAQARVDAPAAARRALEPVASAESERNAQRLAKGAGG